jgi:hypothetical protein
MIYIIAGSMSGMVFNLFSGGSSYSSDPSKYSHLNPDGTIKKKAVEDTSAEKTEKKEKKSSKTSSSTKKKSSKKEKAN